MQEYEEEKPAKHDRGSRKDDLVQAAATPLPGDPANEEDDADEYKRASKHAEAATKGRKAGQAVQKGGSSDIHAQSPDVTHSVRKVLLLPCKHTLGAHPNVSFAQSTNALVLHLPACQSFACAALPATWMSVTDGSLVLSPQALLHAAGAPQQSTGSQGRREAAMEVDCTSAVLGGSHGSRKSHPASVAGAVGSAHAPTGDACTVPALGHKGLLSGAHPETASRVGAQREPGPPSPEVPPCSAASPSTHSHAGPTILWMC